MWTPLVLTKMVGSFLYPYFLNTSNRYTLIDMKDGENPFELAVPISAYTSSKSGNLNVKAEIRSRSPTPKEGNEKA